MAKSLRARTKKSNKTKLRNRVFGPIEAARTERLSMKLLKLATGPQPKTNVDAEAEPALKQAKTQAGAKMVPADDEMDLDSSVASTRKAVKSSESMHTPKKRRGKASATMVFATHPKKKKVGSCKGPERA
ncbi:hypothetical protein MMC14_008264 [Varicellaria rhodocarpa]|nr:hypothetical protein [Varicellaria rhodocarpa]